MRMTTAIGWGVRLVVLACAALLSGCVYSDSLRHDEFWPVRGPPAGGHVQTSVFYATDREAEGDSFNLHWGASLHCGEASLTLTSQHGFDFAGTPDAPEDCDNPAAMAAFAAKLVAAARQQNCDRLLVVMHGYNTTFRTAVLSGGQLSLDVKWRCPTLLFSWSSEGKFDRYVADIERSGYAVPTLAALLRAAGAEGLKLDIIAHSMGSRITLSALGAVCGSSGGSANLTSELIVVAPDVNAERGNDDFGHLLKRVAPCVGRATVYASDNDMALMVSESVHGGVSRAGRVPLRDLQYVGGGYGNIDIVDASLAPGDPEGHGYFTLSYETTDDMAGVIAGKTLAQRAASGGLYCQDLAGSACADGGGHYALQVSAARRPDWVSRLVRHIWPLILPLR
jgi:esterase/lipase superfamily enzyme